MIKETNDSWEIEWLSEWGLLFGHDSSAGNPRIIDISFISQWTVWCVLGKISLSPYFTPFSKLIIEAVCLEGGRNSDLAAPAPKWTQFPVYKRDDDISEKRDWFLC